MKQLIENSLALNFMIAYGDHGKLIRLVTELYEEARAAGYSDTDFEVMQEYLIKELNHRCALELKDNRTR